MMALWLTLESLLTPVACAFHLTIGTACSLNLCSHRDITRSCGKSCEEKKYSDNIFSGTNIELTEAQFALLAAEADCCAKCVRIA